MRLRTRVHAFLLFLVFTFLEASGEAGGANDLFSRYRRDQNVGRVVVGQTRLEGELRGGELLLSERDAIEMALRNNLGVNVRRLDPVFSTWEAEKLRSAYDPTTSFGFNWDRTNAPTASILAGGDTITDIFTNYDFSFQKPFSKGSSIEASFSGARNRSTNFFTSLVPAIDTDLKIEFRQNLLRGLGKVDTEYRLEVARNNVDISEMEFAQQVLDTVTEVQIAYWDLLFSRRDIDVKQKSLELAQEILSQNQARFEVGSAARLEVVEAEAEVASRKEQLVRSQFRRKQIQDRLVSLITSFEDPRELKAEILPTQRPFVPDPVLDNFDLLMSRARERRPELLQADAQIVNNRVELDRTRNQLKPDLDMVLAFRLIGLGGNRVIRDFSDGFENPPVVGFQPGGIGDSFSQLFSGDFYGYTVGLDLRLPFGNVDARADNAKAQINLQRTELQRQAAAQRVAREIREALTEIDMNYASLEAASATVRLGQERLEGEQARFEVGRGTTRTVIEAQRDLVLAAVTELQAQVNLIKSHVQLDRATGATLEKHQIRTREQLTRNLR